MRNKPVILQIGLIRYEPSWELLFRQIGISWKIISEENLIENYSVIIVNEDIELSINLIIDSYVAEGGTVLYTSTALHNNHSKVIKKKYIASLPPVRNTLYSIYGILDIYEQCLIFSNNDIVEIESSGNGYKAYLGIPCNIVLSSDSQRKNFPSDSLRMPNEIVSRRTKGTFRQLVFSLFVHLHQIQDIPFLHKWYYPNGSPTIFTFRIDSDKGTQEQVEEIYQLSEKYSIPTTWFLDVKSHESWIGYFKKFISQEIAVHCYEHSISQNKEINSDNFLKAKTILNQTGINVEGFSGPTGMWNESLASTIEGLGFDYSSEFGFDYDNLPSFPFYSGRFSQIPQLPIHPICIGSMLRAHMTDDEMISYFKKIIDRNYVLKEPICLYHHPTHRHNKVFEEIFSYIQIKKISPMSYSDYASWWKKRDAESICWKYNKNKLFTIEPVYGSGHTRVILPNGNECISVLNGITDIDQMKFTSPIVDFHLSNNIMRARAIDLHHILQNALDWWIKITE
jgi:hypothetical protein